MLLGELVKETASSYRWVVEVRSRLDGMRHELASLRSRISKRNLIDHLSRAQRALDVIERTLQEVKNPVVGLDAAEFSLAVAENDIKMVRDALPK